jgi:hypothetical protein
MATYYSTTVAKAQGTTFSNQFKFPVGLSHGRVRVTTGVAQSVSGSLDLAALDVVVVGVVKATDRFMAQISFGDGGEDTAGQTFDVGLYERAETGLLGAVADADCFDAGAAFGVTAGIGFGSASENHIGKQFWEIAGAASEEAAPEHYYVTLYTGGSAFDAADYRFGAAVLYTSGD